MNQKKKTYPPNKVSSYFYAQIPTLAVITVTGIIYNVGMIAGPWFEGKLAQCLFDNIGGSRKPIDMLKLALLYMLTIGMVQGFRYLKRLYVRKFANQTSKSMKKTIYSNLVHLPKTDVESDQVGALMTRALSDAEACSEGMRKFTTEIFDTGVVMISYLTILFYYDWRLTLLVIFFPFAACLFSEKLKILVTKSVADAKKSAERLNGATLDRISNSMTYRVYGQEEQRNQNYEGYLKDYKYKTIKANLLESTTQPIYQVIAMTGTIFILWLGGKNVAGEGFCLWNIAAFSTYLSCFLKMAVKSSKVAKLFNAVQKARVSWQRIKPYLLESPVEEKSESVTIHQLEVKDLSFAYPQENPIFSHVSFQAKAGQMIGVAGEVACGKSTLGKVFLNEYPYSGTILLDGEEWFSMSQRKVASFVGYLGHDPELMSASIRDNICMGETKDPMPYIYVTRLDEEIANMPEGLDTEIGGDNMRISGGQQARVALCRTLYHKRPILILDDPFSAVDFKTEKEILEQLRVCCKDCIILLISHRLRLFGELDGVLWMKDGRVTASTHDALMESEPDYRKLYEMQKGGTANEAK